MSKRSLVLFINCFSFLVYTTAVKADFLPKSFKANFTQEYISTLKGKVKKGNGAIDYKYPSNIRFETTNPTHVLYVTNGERSWYYTFPFVEGEQGELSESSAKDGNGLFTKFFDSLKNGLKSNAMYDVKKSAESFLITFKNNSAKEIGVKNAKLTFANGKESFESLQVIEVEFNDSKKSTMKLSELVMNPNFEADHFKFQNPINVKKAPQKN